MSEVTRDVALAGFPQDGTHNKSIDRDALRHSNASFRSSKLRRLEEERPLRLLRGRRGCRRNTRFFARAPSPPSQFARFFDERCQGGELEHVDVIGRRKLIPEEHRSVGGGDEGSTCTP